MNKNDLHNSQGQLESDQNIAYKIVYFRYSGMESRFQRENKTSEDEIIGQFQQNNKRNTMTLNVSGLWDVGPRLDHYRYISKYKMLFFLGFLLCLNVLQF